MVLKSAHYRHAPAVPTGVFAVLLVAMVGVIVWQVLGDREPVYQGKRLSDWLLSYNVVFASSDSEEKLRQWTEADEAMRQMGINAVPALLLLFRKRK